ncbi:MAG: hypothetical protein LBM64_02725 [Deltaproteobacteria bacterium]|jgi:hypothetical protein|nr:hypothetical protein [Deltaproteobacteria bacterium]
MDLELYYTRLALPLLRLTATMCIGLLAASLLESLHWTRFVAKLAAPLARAGNLREVSAASFALAFFSPAAANSLLAEALARGELSRRELVFANLFNSSPAFMVHLPTLFSLVFAFLGPLAFVYVGLTFTASLLRTFCTLLAGRIFLPLNGKDEPAQARASGNKSGWRETVNLTWRRFKKRCCKLLLYTLPVYILFFALQQVGAFAAVEHWLAGRAEWLGFLNPQSLGIVAMHLVAEQGAALAAAASLADSGNLAGSEIIMALLAGNIVSSPMRALRHQLPSYAGYFAPALALRLVLVNQACRAASLICVTTGYYFYAF